MSVRETTIGQYALLEELCELQAKINDLKAQLSDTLEEGETIECPLGKLLKTKEVRETVWNAEGKRRYEQFKADSEALGLCKIVMTPSQLRLTLSKGA